MDFEGRCLTQDPHDPGGQTFWGISRVNHPEWGGWKWIDFGERQSPSLISLVQDFYLKEFWQVAQCQEYQSQELANQVFDAFVNLGGRGLKLLQSLLGVTVDGQIGPDTLDMLAKQDQDYLAKNYITAREGYYKDLVSQHPNLARYLNGWLNRCVPSVV